MHNELVNRAVKFASEHHANHLYGTDPYIVHLLSTLDKVNDHKALWAKVPVCSLTDVPVKFEFVQAAAVLHDVVEDCKDVSGQMINDLFGAEVAMLVWSVTDVPGKTKLEQIPILAGRMEICPAGVGIKLADRSCNTLSGLNNDVYRKLQPVLEANLYTKRSVWEPLCIEILINLGLDKMAKA